MIGMKYTPELLADLAKTPRLRSVGVPTTPDGQAIASYTKRYTEERGCKTMVFDADSDEVSVIEETYTAVDTFTSFFEDDTAFDPWLHICEPV